MSRGVPTEGTVAHRIRRVRDALAPAELRVATALLDGDPTSGLVSIAQLAAEAGVSPPTALRLVTKLGFPGYGAFQDALRAEVRARLFTPVTEYPDGAGTAVGDDPLAAVEQRYAEGLRSTLGGLADHDLCTTVDALATADRIVILGGRFSGVLAAQLFQYLRVLRPGVVLVPDASADRLVSMVDVDADTFVVVFDQRRYQSSTIAWAKEAADRGARMVLITDPYLSPLASRADAVLVASHVGAGPFDSMAHGVVVVELLISRVATAIGDPARTRLADFEGLHLAAERDHGHPVK